MPRKKAKYRSADTLVKLCMIHIGHTISNIDSFDTLHNFQCHFGEVICTSDLAHLGFPFYNFNTILDDVIKNKRLNAFNVQLVFTANRHSLVLCDLFSNKWDNVYHRSLVTKLGQECQKLQSLDLEGCTSIPPYCLIQLIGQLKQLKHLNLLNTHCNNDVINYIWESSEKLVSLNLPNNSEIDDLSLNSLKPSSDFPLSYRLIKLICCSPNLSANGVIKILQSFPQMQILKCMHLIEAVELVLAEKSMDKFPPLQSLGRPIHFKHDKFREWNQMLRSCKYIVELSIYGGRNYFNSDDIKLLKNLKNLKELQYFEETLLNDYNKYQFMQIINVCGKQLEIVLFFGWNQVFDILEFGRCCPKLQLLHIWGGKLMYKSNLDNNRNLYRNLNALHIISPCLQWTMQQQTTSAFIILLKQCVNIKILQLMDVPIIDDNIINIVLRGNIMYYLEDLDFYNIPNITTSSMYRFLNQFDNLRTLKIRECSSIQTKDYDQLLKYSDSNQLDIDIIHV